MKDQHAELSTKVKMRKEKIYQAACNLFFEKGYRLTTIDQIVNKAGYSKPAFYLDYSNKDDIFVRIATDGLALLLEKLQAIPVGQMSLLEYIERYAQIIAEFAFEERKYFRMFVAEVIPDILDNSSEETRLRAAEIEKEGFGLVATEVERAMEEGIIPDVDPWKIAGIFIGSVVGISILSFGGSQVVYRKEELVSKVQDAGRIMIQGLVKK